MVSSVVLCYVDWHWHPENRRITITRQLKKSNNLKFVESWSLKSYSWTSSWNVFVEKYIVIIWIQLYSCGCMAYANYTKLKQIDNLHDNVTWHTSNIDFFEKIYTLLTINQVLRPHRRLYVSQGASHQRSIQEPLDFQCPIDSPPSNKALKQMSEINSVDKTTIVTLVTRRFLVY